MYLFIGCSSIISILYILSFCIYYNFRIKQKVSAIEQLEIEEELKKEEDENYSGKNDFISGRAIYLKYKN